HCHVFVEGHGQTFSHAGLQAFAELFRAVSQFVAQRTPCFVHEQPRLHDSSQFQRFRHAQVNHLVPCPLQLLRVLLDGLGHARTQVVPLARLQQANTEASAGRLHCRLPMQAHCGGSDIVRSEEHTSELQSRENLVCRLLLEKKKKIQSNDIRRHAMCTHD